VFAPQIGPDLKLARLNIELARKDLQRNEVETRFMVTRAYLAVLLSKENLANQQVNLQRQQTLVQELEARVKASQAEPFDLDRAQLQLNNLQVAVERSATAVAQSLLSLKYQMAYPLDRDLVLVDSLLLKEYQEEAALLSPQSVQPEGRVEWKIQAIQLDQRILELRKARNAYIPTVSFFAQTGSQFQSNRFNLFDFSNAWFGAVFLGARVQVPLFDGLQRDAKIQQARLALAQSRLTQQALNRQLEHEIHDAWLSYVTAVRHLTEQKNNVIIAERALNRIQARYFLNQETYREVENLRADLQQAQNNYFITLYDLAVARLSLLKAMGSL
jgi:outer membrane protein TolC